MNWETEQIIHVTSGNYSQADYLHFSAMADDLFITAELDEEKSLRALAEKIQEYFVEYAPAIEGIYAALITGALEEVDWKAVAESVLEPVMEMHHE